MPSDESVGLAGPATVGASTLRKVVTGATIGNAVEWFDFAIYGFLATYIAANFFPSGDETVKVAPSRLSLEASLKSRWSLP